MGDLKLPKTCGAIQCRNEAGKGRLWFVDSIVNGLPVRAMVVLCEEHGKKASPDRDVTVEDFLKMEEGTLREWRGLIDQALGLHDNASVAELSRRASLRN